MINKKIIFTGEFFTKLVQRQIFDIFDNMENCVKEIERKMKEESIIIDNPNYENQKWCLFTLKNIGLVKVPFVETQREVIAITIAHPVTDQICHDAFNVLRRDK
ncbi:MAG: hypothetical protein HY831_04825 [Candidatus Aenigmarchaeota archaeon]|nr:hypothetical protein [Candidatus Aenigmarchaeota archaeon]